MLPFMEEHLSRTPRAATLLGSHTLSQLLQPELICRSPVSITKPACWKSWYGWVTGRPQ